MDVLVIEVDDGVATITLNRPAARNALNAALRAAVPAAIAELDARDDVGAIVLTGADPAFCAGLDLKELAAGGGDADLSGTVIADRGPFGPRRTPIVGAVNGVAITGGLEYALHCDFLVASERARFADTHTRVGILPGWGLTVLLPEAIGVRRAKQMSLSGNQVDAATALAWGLVNVVVPHEQLLDVARGIARDIAAAPRAATARLKAVYDEHQERLNGELWAAESAASRQWLAEHFSRDALAASRGQIQARGRGQL